MVRVDIEAGVTLVVLMGRRSFQRSGLKVGEETAAFFEPAAAHVFARE